ncbi:MAG: hypothetical protein LBP92_00355 [Deltaproteobacteria bacterium]|jgi:hypothetical protein|nr:hypothetical protein [Deltaproteobacteria bacterium]
MKQVDLCDPTREPTDEELNELVSSVTRKAEQRNRKALADFYSDLTAQIAAINDEPGHDDIAAAE